MGEVFTSPKLTGTNGVLHVSEIYLNKWKFENLTLQIKDGFIEKYSCSNYPTEKENTEYINEHLLFDHPTLPVGEFAIGTNTYAYVMGNKYNINDKLDILIAEKTGPHFAFGDTCFSLEEHIDTFNPDGKKSLPKIMKYQSRGFLIMLMNKAKHILVAIQILLFPMQNLVISLQYETMEQK